jgi:hypothetical protein
LIFFLHFARREIMLTNAFLSCTLALQSTAPQPSSRCRYDRSDERCAWARRHWFPL